MWFGLCGCGLISRNARSIGQRMLAQKGDIHCVCSPPASVSIKIDDMMLIWTV